MRSIDQRTGLEILDPLQCLLLLGRTRFGRLAAVVDGQPMIWPVNCARDGGSIVFRIDEGTKLDAVIRQATVAFEIDEIDPAQYAGWSVIVKGTAEEISDPEELAKARQLRFRPWAPGIKAHWIRVRPTEMTGRRIVRLADGAVAFDG